MTNMKTFIAEFKNISFPVDTFTNEKGLSDIFKKSLPSTFVEKAAANFRSNASAFFGQNGHSLRKADLFYSFNALKIAIEVKWIRESKKSFNQYDIQNSFMQAVMYHVLYELDFLVVAIFDSGKNVDEDWLESSPECTLLRSIIKAYPKIIIVRVRKGKGENNVYWNSQEGC